MHGIIGNFFLSFFSCSFRFVCEKGKFVAHLPFLRRFFEDRLNGRNVYKSLHMVVNSLIFSPKQIRQDIYFPLMINCHFFFFSFFLKLFEPAAWLI